MECNKDEARRAIDVALRKLSENDYNGAKKFVDKARDLYPKLDGLEQVLVMIEVHISASNKNIGGGESDWYGILGVDPSSDDETMKKRYKKLALLLHPDKNRFSGAEGAFRLVSDALCLLSDKAKRFRYDQKRKSKEAEEQKRQHEPASCNVNRNAKEDSSKQEQQSSANSQATSRRAKEAERPPKRKFKRKTTKGNLNTSFEDPSSTLEAQRLFKRPMTTGNPSSTLEAQRLFKRPMTTGNPNSAGDPNSTFEAARLFCLFKNPALFYV